MKKPLSERQADLLRAIKDSIAEHGYPPTVRELASLMGISSTNGVNDHLKALERKGYLVRLAGKSRAIVLLEDDAPRRRIEMLEAEIKVVRAENAELRERLGARARECPSDTSGPHGMKKQWAWSTDGGKEWSGLCGSRDAAIREAKANREPGHSPMVAPSEWVSAKEIGPDADTVLDYAAERLRDEHWGGAEDLDVGRDSIEALQVLLDDVWSCWVDRFKVETRVFVVDSASAEVLE